MNALRGIVEILIVVVKSAGRVQSSKKLVDERSLCE